MQRATLLNQVEAVDGCYFAIGEQFADDAEGAVVVFGLAEGGDEHAVVDDEEVDVGGRQDRQAPAGDVAGLRERDFRDFEGSAAGALE